MKYNELLTGLLNELRSKIDSDDFLSEFRVPRRFIRKGMISLRQMVLYLLFHSKKTLDGRCSEFRKNYPDCSFPDVSKQALSKARFGIMPELFKTLLDSTVDFYYDHLPSRKTWKDRYHLMAVDGSDMNLPSSESIFDYFGKEGIKDQPGKYFSQGKASILYDVYEDIIVDAYLGRMHASERDLAARHLARLRDLGLQLEDTIVIFDRGYFSAELLLECVRAGCYCLMRLPRSMDICSIDGSKNVVTITCDDKSQVCCMVYKVVLDTGEEEFLLTNLFDYDLKPNDFKELYFYRWGVETKYLELKEQWKIEEFTGTGVPSVLQDFYITAMYANVSAVIKKAADDKINDSANSNNYYRYQARRSFIIGEVQRMFIEWVLSPPSEEAITAVILSAAKKKSQINPGRKFKREKSRKQRITKKQKATF